MKNLYKLAVAVLGAAFFIASAQAQNPGAVSNHAVPVGKGPGISGFTSVAPGSAGIPLTSNGASSDPSFSAVAAAGIQSNAVTNAKINPGSANTFKGSLDGAATSDIALTACSAVYQVTKWVSGTGWQCGLNPVLPSRATAATLDLSAHSVVQTLGYATAGDGGGALFVKAGSTPFRDSFVTSGSITSAGSGCTNGTTYKVLFSGGTGRGFFANVVAAGNVVTTVTIVNSGGSGYTVGDVLTGSITGCTFTWTVSAVSTPLASFTDTAGNRWQYTVDSGNYINPRQFGVKADFSTDDQPSIQAAIKFAYYQNYTSLSNGCPGGGGSCGSVVLLPAGTMVINNTITVYDAIELKGHGEFSSGLLLGSSFPAGDDAIHLCDTNIHLACFGARVTDLSVTSPASLFANNATYLFYSNAVQQTVTLERVAMYSLGRRGCLKYTNGYGGAAKVNFFDLFCTLSPSNASDGIVLDPTTTVNMQFDGGLIVEAGSTGYTGNAINWQSGNLFINGFHTEGIATGIYANNATSTHQGYLEGATGGNLCTELVKLSGTNTLGNFRVGTSQINGCNRLITNGQPGGSNFAGNTVKQITCNPGAPCN